MRAWFFCLILGLSVPLSAAEAPLKEVRLVSAEWAGYTNRDGSGLVWDIMRLVFEPVGLKVSHRTELYTRGVGLVQRGEADGWLGSYANEGFEGVINGRVTYGIDPIVALGLADRPVPSLEGLGQYRLAWVRGYGYQRYLPGVSAYREVERRTGILEMLDRGRADFYIDARPDVEEVRAQSPEPDRYRVTPLTGIPLYPGFADTEHGRRLAALYERRMKAVTADGSLRRLYKRWREPYLIDSYRETSNASH